MRTNEYTLLGNCKFGGIRSYRSSLPPQHRTYRAHHHTECEISVVLSGSGTYAVCGKQYAFSAGDAFLFGSNEEHCITEIAEEFELLNVQFEPYLLWERTDSAELLSLFTSRSSSFENRLEDREGMIRGSLLELERELRDKKQCYAVAARYVLFMMLTHIIRNYSCIDHSKSVKASDSITHGLRLAIDYIQENLESKLTLKELADVACLSPTYFSSVFKKFNGISLWEYISIKRVERAVDMLKNEKITKLEVAERCGFSSSSNFYKTFTAITGKRPGDFTD
ncbi:MAG: helix-turn-helix transcriptional regulator [Clostridia bacterium]|nr:helix-turn-helix transcriptional regulator [Clostridia bacterium]